MNATRRMVLAVALSALIVVVVLTVMQWPSMNGDTSATRAQVETLEQTLTAQQQELRSLETQRQVLTDEMNQLRERLERLEAEQRELEEALGDEAEAH